MCPQGRCVLHLWWAIALACHYDNGAPTLKYTHIHTLQKCHFMLISCHHHIYGTYYNEIPRQSKKNVTNVTPMLADPKPYHTEYSAIIRSLSSESDMTARKLPFWPWGVSRVLKSHFKQIKDQWLFIKHHVNFITAPAEKSQKQLKHCC